MWSRKSAGEQSAVDRVLAVRGCGAAGQRGGLGAMGRSRPGATIGGGGAVMVRSQTAHTGPLSPVQQGPFNAENRPAVRSATGVY
jgi:hypothetical protein